MTDEAGRKPSSPAAGGPSSDGQSSAAPSASPSSEEATSSSVVAGENKGQDVVLLGPPTADGNGVHVLRARNERLEAGELRALRDGQPVTGEVLSIVPRKDTPRICDVKESWSADARAPEAPKAAPARSGPAQVATSAYRDGWDHIFGAPKARPRREDLN